MLTLFHPMVLNRTWGNILFLSYHRIYPYLSYLFSFTVFCECRLENNTNIQIKNISVKRNGIRMWNSLRIKQTSIGMVIPCMPSLYTVPYPICFFIIEARRSAGTDKRSRKRSLAMVSPNAIINGNRTRSIPIPQ